MRRPASGSLPWGKFERGGRPAAQGHEFWPDGVTLFDNKRVDSKRLLDDGQVTDTYLLELAQAHGGKLATLDLRLVTGAVRGAAQWLHLISYDVVVC
jgi:hypothetical protein